MSEHTFTSEIGGKSAEIATDPLSAASEIDCALLSVDLAKTATETLSDLIVEERLGVDETGVFFGGIIAELEKARGYLVSAHGLACKVTLAE